MKQYKKNPKKYQHFIAKNIVSVEEISKVMGAYLKYTVITANVQNKNKVLNYLKLPSKFKNFRK